LAYEVGKVSGVTPARRKYYERTMFQVGFSSTATLSTGVASTEPTNLFMSAASTENPIINYSTRVDFIHVYFCPDVAASSFFIRYYNIDSTLQAWDMIVSTAVTLANNGYNWVVPLPGRTGMAPCINVTSSTGYFTLITNESFGDQHFGNK
jgi:hypothetical protein